jgi:hypothetical protein
MLRDEAVVRVQDGLAFRKDRETEIVKRMQEVQRDLERGKTLPSFLKTSDTESLLAGAQSYTLPTDFLRITNDRIQIDPDGTTDPRYWRRLSWASLETISKVEPTVTGSPRYVVLNKSAGLIYFDVYLATPQQIYFQYYRKADLLTSNIENLWLEHAPELIIGDAGRRIAADMRNQTAVQLFSTMYNECRATWFKEAIQDEQDEEGFLVLGGAN